MKTYVILTYNIINIGGAQLYTNSKVKYLENYRWKVKVYSSSSMGNFLIKDLEKFSSNIIPELAISPMTYSSQKREQIIDKMSDGLCDNDEIVIESNYISLSLWGELLASKYQAKHLIYDLNESIKCSKNLFPFFKFKFDRGELAVINPNIIEEFFKPYFKVNNAKNYVLNAVYSIKQVDDIEIDIHEINTTRYTIGVIGRLNKPFVLKISQDLQKYIINNPSRYFNVIYIGGDEAGENVTGQIKNIFSTLSNCSLYMMGYRFPIPRKLLQLFDVCFSNSGAARAAASEGIITIPVDSDDLCPIGILGITTSNTLFHTDESIMDITYWLDELAANRYSKKQITGVEPVIESLDSLAAHFDYISKSVTKKEYYTDFRKTNIIKRITLALFGVKGYIRLQNAVANIICKY